MISGSRQQKRASKSRSKSQAASDVSRRARGPSYDIRAIEPKWRERWQESGLYRTDLRAAERPFYNLMMFPYPSAEGLHVGNMYAFTGADIYGRFQAMRGYDVFEPMGFDAFGIHSENYAIKRGIHPRVLTARQRRALPRDAAQAQSAALRLEPRGQYHRPALLPLDAVDLRAALQGRAGRATQGAGQLVSDRQTVLADEQVIDGRCERCDTPVEQRELEQWFCAITAYAERLLAQPGHAGLVRTTSRPPSAHWIGRCEGARVRACRVAGSRRRRSTCSPRGPTRSSA